MLTLALTIPSTSAAVTFVLILLIVGVAYSLLEGLMAEPFRKAARVVVVVLLVVALLRLFGLV
jgi:uncharacterized ion transporter superfamily protein YfcC